MGVFPIMAAKVFPRFLVNPLLAHLQHCCMMLQVLSNSSQGMVDFWLCLTVQKIIASPDKSAWSAVGESWEDISAGPRVRLTEAGCLSGGQRPMSRHPDVSCESLPPAGCPHIQCMALAQQPGGAGSAGRMSCCRCR